MLSDTSHKRKKKLKNCTTKNKLLLLQLLTKNKKIMTTFKGYAVFSIPTREARIFAGMKPERVSKIYDKYDEELREVLESFQKGGYYDETISCYTVKSIK